MAVVGIKLNLGTPTAGQLSHSHIVSHCPPFVQFYALFLKILDDFANYSLSSECYANRRRFMKTGKNLLQCGCSTFAKKPVAIFLEKKSPQYYGIEERIFHTFWHC